MKLFQQPTMNHTPHILASVFLCGLWLPIWIISALSDNQHWRCSFCGYTAATKYLADPTLYQREQKAFELAAVKRANVGQKSQPFDFIGDFISNHLLGSIVVAVCVVLASIVLAGTFITNTLSKKPSSVKTSVPSKTPVVWSESQKLDKRRYFASKLNGTGGYVVELKGKNQDTLLITHFLMTKEKLERFINETSAEMPYERAGFAFVEFQTSNEKKARRWVYDVSSHSFK